MPTRSFTQTSFLGGEWSPASMGRIDHPDYVRALAESFNGITLEEGAWVKRGGFADVGSTFNGNPGIVRTWYITLNDGSDPTKNNAVNLELTYGTGGCRLQAWSWSTFAAGPLFSVAAPYGSLAEVLNVQMVATDIGVFFLSKNTKPWLLSYTYVSNTWAYQDAHFEKLDGPYIDPLHGASQTMNSVGHVSGQGPGSITFTIDDASYSFVSNDVGRAIRLWNQPQAYNSGTTYFTGAVVTYDGNYWISLTGASSSGVTPGTQANISGFIVVPWALVPQQGTWAYGYITAVAGSSCTVTLITSLPYAFSATLANGNSTTIDTWQLGVYFTGHYPACGTFHESRLWLGGASPGRIDASMTNGVPLDPTGVILGNNGAFGPLFSPTDNFGTVADNHGISEVFSTEGTNNPLWFLPEHSGIIMGTAFGEWLITASNLNDPLTPTSIQIHKSTRYGGAQTKAIRVGIAMAFIQAFRRRVVELVSDVFSGRFVGRHINEFSKHLSQNSFTELSYQEEPAPIIWANDSNGFLFGCTYRRVSHFGQEPPQFTAWHKHNIAGGTGLSRFVVSHADTAINNGLQSSLIVLTADSNTLTNCRLQVMIPPHEANQPIAQTTWCLDSSCNGVLGHVTITDAAAPGVRFVVSGINSALNGKAVHVYLCGLDFGPYTVSGGAVTIPYASDPDRLGTPTYLFSFANPSASVYGFWATPITIQGVSGYVPCVVGLPYSSAMQLPRPASAQIVDGQTGPGFGKTRRLHMWSVLVTDSPSAGLTVAGDTNMNFGPVPTYPIAFRAPNMTALPSSTPFTGVHWDTVASDYTFDNQITINSLSPHSLTINAVSGFIEVQDR